MCFSYDSSREGAGIVLTLYNHMPSRASNPYRQDLYTHTNSSHIMTILAAVGGEHEPDRVVTVGEDLANAYDEDLLVVNVIPQDEFERRDDVHKTEQYTIEDGQNDAKSVAQSVVKATSDRPGRIRTRGLVGEVVEELLGETDRVNAGYLVISGRKRTAVGKALFGSTTQSVLLNSDIPVVAVMDSV